MDSDASCRGLQMYRNLEQEAAEIKDREIKNRNEMQQHDIMPGSELDSCGGNPSITG